MSDELHRKWKEAVVAFNILSQQLPGVIQKNHGVTSVMAAPILRIRSKGAVIGMSSVIII